MEPLIIENTEFSPQVILDPVSNKFVLSGESRPENSGKFYEPIVKWLEQYQTVLFWQKDKFGTPPKMIFEFKLEYFNSTSAKYLMDILRQLDTYYSEKIDVKILWFNDENDEDMRESGEEFAKLVKVPFEYLFFDKN